MKRLVLPRVLVACSLCAAVFSTGLSALAQDSAATTAAPATPPATLPYGVEDVLKLSRAQVGDDTIINFVQNSGTVYNLGANDIVYLRKEGVSDRVIKAMLDQKKKFVDAAPAPTTPPQTAAAPPASPAEQPAPATTQPAPVYVQPPATPPASSVYVVPSPDYAYYGYYRPYPYYYYPGYYGPSISLGFRFGGSYGYHGYHHWGGGWGHHR